MELLWGDKRDDSCNQRRISFAKVSCNHVWLIAGREYKTAHRGCGDNVQENSYKESSSHHFKTKQPQYWTPVVHIGWVQNSKRCSTKERYHWYTDLIHKSLINHATSAESTRIAHTAKGLNRKRAKSLLEHLKFKICRQHSSNVRSGGNITRYDWSP